MHVYILQRSRIAEGDEYPPMPAQAPYRVNRIADNFEQMETAKYNLESLDSGVEHGTFVVPDPRPL